MTETGPQHIHSRDNALLKDLRRLAHDNTAYRKQRRIWLEGEHLCRAVLQRGREPALRPGALYRAKPEIKKGNPLLPPPAPRRWGSAACEQKNVPNKSISMTLRHALGLIDSDGT